MRSSSPGMMDWARARLDAKVEDFDQDGVGRQQASPAAGFRLLTLPQAVVGVGQLVATSGWGIPYPDVGHVASRASE